MTIFNDEKNTKSFRSKKERYNFYSNLLNYFEESKFEFSFRNENDLVIGDINFQRKKNSESVNLQIFYKEFNSMESVIGTFLMSNIEINAYIKFDKMVTEVLDEKLDVALSAFYVLNRNHESIAKEYINMLNRRNIFQQIFGLNIDSLRKYLTVDIVLKNDDAIESSLLLNIHTERTIFKKVYAKVSLEMKDYSIIIDPNIDVYNYSGGRKELIIL